MLGDEHVDFLADSDSTVPSNAGGSVFSWTRQVSSQHRHPQSTFRTVADHRWRVAFKRYSSAQEGTRCARQRELYARKQCSKSTRTSSYRPNGFKYTLSHTQALPPQTRTSFSTDQTVQASYLSAQLDNCLCRSNIVLTSVEIPGSFRWGVSIQDRAQSKRKGTWPMMR